MEDARAATADDLPVIVALARAMRRELGPMRGGSIWAAREARGEPLDDAYAALLETDDALVAVGTIDGTIVGFGVGEVEVLRDGSRLGILSDLYVDPGARAVGVGEAIAGMLVAHCVAAGCTGIDAHALPGNRAAKNFFERSGFTARLLVMHRSGGRVG